MQLIRFLNAEGNETWGLNTSEGYVDCGALMKTCPTMLDAIQEWDAIRGQIDELSAKAPKANPNTRLLSPVPEIGNTICIGLNYRDHAIETGAEIPTEPVVFSKLKGALCGQDDEVPLPTVSSKVDFEAELVIVIGSRTANVSLEESEDSIFGYMCGHDVSARDWQKGRPGGQWLLGKSFPHFGPVGPFLVPKEFVDAPCDLNISLRINGETFQDSNTKQLIFKPLELVSHLSQCTILQPGDMIFTGTPPGVGAARTPPRFLRSGDVCEVEIQGLGVLRNRFV